jgi:hypothetical protein
VFEAMEARRLLSTTPILVTKTVDDGSAGTLRDAIDQANAASGPAVIDFAIPGAGVQTITLTTDLPQISHPVTIDGTSQGGAGYQGLPLIELVGSGSTTGLDFAAGSDGSVVRGLDLHGFSTSAIVIAANALTVAGNEVGTDPAGTTGLGNGDGIEIDGANNLIGGTTAADRNILSGNINDGILITGAGATGNVVSGNFIGTDRNGTAVLGNLNTGVTINNAPGNFIGGTNPGAGNVISGNGTAEGQGAGLLINGPGATGNFVQGNFIGTNAAGTVQVANLGFGVAIVDAPGNTLGGTTPQARNIISGNAFSGVLISSAGATGNVIAGNFIGIAADGVHALGNTDDGITLSVADDNLIGGTAVGAGNVIAGNGMNGILITGGTASGNLVQGNFLGTNASNASNLGNSLDGVLVTGSASDNTIGGTVAGAGNTIADNGRTGVVIASGTGDAILGNSIVANHKLGIDLGDDGVTPNHPVGTGTGPNNLQNFPVLTSVVSTGTSTVIQGTLNSTPETSFRLEFFANDAADPSGFGQGQLFLGAATLTVTTGPDGTATFTRTVPFALKGTQFVTATATDPNDNTSEFSADAPVIAPTFSINDVSQAIDSSGTGGLDFTVTLSAASGLPASVAFATMDGTATVANHDYQPTSGTLTFPAGVTTRTIAVPIFGDPNGDPTKTFTVLLGSPQGALIARGQGTGTINNIRASGQFQFSMPTFVTTQDAGHADITVTRTGGDAGSVSVTFATAGGTAVPGVDYTTVSQTVTFGPGQDSQTVAVPVLANLLLGGNKTVGLTLGNPTNGASLGPQSTAVLTIVNANSLTVTNTNDSGPGSLRQAILTANANPAPNTVTFAIPGAGPFLIQPLSPLPAINDPVTIDGTTQPGAQSTPIVILDGILAGPSSDGLDINSGPSTIRGLAIVRFSGDGILVQGNGGNVIEGNLIGTDAAGDAGLGNGFDGIAIDNSPNNTIGGLGNVLSDNGQVGLRIAGAAASGNLALGNLIGTDPSGTKPLGNHVDGVFIDGAPNNAIGDGAPGERNIISANAIVGIQVDGPGATGNLVQGNLIGTDANGLHGLGNGLDGVFLDGAVQTLIGGTSPALRNIISGNSAVGVRIAGAGSSGNVVQGNFIGTDSSGVGVLGNGFDGVFTIEAPNNTIGGTAAGAGNVISGNGVVGVQLYGTGSSGNVVQGNFIGTDSTGTVAMGNGLDGVFVNDAPNNTIGGPMAGARNLISANHSSGIQLLDPGAKGNVVQGNIIGGDIRGAARLGNAYGIFVNNAPGNTLGGPGSAQNLIAGNTRANVFQNSGSGGPVVTGVTSIQGAGRITSIVLSFSNALDPARAQSLANYHLQQSGRRAPLSSAVYDPVARTVTLTLAHPVPIGTRLRLTVGASPPGGLADLSGHLLDGDNNGLAGGNFVTTLAPKPPSTSTSTRRVRPATHPPTHHGTSIASRRISLGRLTVAKPRA